MKNLAIVIPAYKADFLDRTLSSIENQTCKNFRVYVGDDASPNNLKAIVDKYTDKIDLHYTKFDKNLGGSDLVGQWTRCVALSENEEWIWLFSDDDEMSENCVEAFYSKLKNESNKEFLHFNVDIIDEQSNVIKTSSFPKKNISDIDFITKKLRGEVSSYVVEYIFSRNLYNRVNGFQKFDLAWNSDDATWVKMASISGIDTIMDAKIRWRKSSVNISPNDRDLSIVRRKVAANLDYVSFLIKHFDGKCSRKDLYVPILTWFIVCLIKYKKVLPKIELRKARLECFRILSMQKISFLGGFYMFFKGILLK
ncbi:MAG: glycosyltransferase family 2 protein [Clostridia bacterium]|nr:glycosyltransferase family 2 protein [Clostridia bacterium]